MNFSASEIAQHVEGNVVGDGGITLTGFAKTDDANPGDLTFAENEKFFRLAEQSQASAILASGELQSDSKTIIQVKDARIAFARILPLFSPDKPFPAGCHPSAVISDSATVASTAYIGPNCVLGENVTIGENAILETNCTVGDNSALGQAARLFPNVSIYSQCKLGDRVRIHAGTVVGSDGFGYVFDQDHHRKIPQIGGVIIEDDVEIGANCTVDRGALGDTKIGRGSKIDNLVQIAHNVVIREHCILVAQNGIGGSSEIGAYSILAGQVGVAGHLKIGPKSTVAAKSGVITELEGNQQYMGYPAIPANEAKRQIIAVKKLPDLAKRVRELEKRIEDLSSKPSGEA
jgi:UDP-3-O-[3-hydroxymyristoyl] glucosamine N-acyltransferase